MKIEIGPEGKIIGTKHVSANGQVSGLTEFAGQDVLVILPGSEGYETKTTSDELINEFQRAAYDHIKLAYRQYSELQDLYKSPTEATKEFLKTFSPTSYQMFLDQLNEWITDQASATEQVIENTIDSTTKKKNESKENKK